MIAVLDFGGQTAHLIARRIREYGVYSQIIPNKTTAKQLRDLKDLEGIVLSGGPASTYEKNSPTMDRKIFNLGIPVLGICYGMQLMGRLLKGKVKPGSQKEYGGVEAKTYQSKLFTGATGKQKVWMSHGDQVAVLPKGFKSVGSTKDTKYIAMCDEKVGLYAVQFHPEVVHTKNGKEILKNFLFSICKAKKNWSKGKYLAEEIARVKAMARGGKVICGLSGGVDSATAAAIVYKAIGSKLRCIYVDTGLMRLGESKQVEADFRKFFGRSLVVVKAEKQFLAKLKKQTDPERKRKIIGELFIRLFEKEAKIWQADYLVQGTIYPDVIESAVKHDAAVMIKSHHNVGGLPKNMTLKLIEPLRDLYKDEVRVVAKKIGLPKDIVWRQPFPGPGLAVRIRGEVTRERLERLRLAEAILQEEAAKFKLPEGIWVTQAIYVPLQTTGVKGDGRSFEEMIAIRSLTSLDAMTADWTRLPYDLLAVVSSRIVNEVPGVNRVVYDITTKPPATMEWE